MVAHFCTAHPCSLCFPTWPQPVFQAQPAGCICPPTSEKTCQSAMCPRKGISAAGPSANTTTLTSNHPREVGK